MHRLRVLIALAAVTFLSVGCGSKNKAALEPASPTGDPSAAEPSGEPSGDPTVALALTRDLIEGSCKNLTAINERDNCGLRFGYDDCVAGFSETDGVEGWELDLRTETLACVRETDNCSTMIACFRLEHDKKVAHGPRKCGKNLATPIVLDEAAASQRRGLDAEKFSEVVSSQAEPIEVCGTSGQLSWLLAAVCDDGTAPFTSRAEAHRARSGNTGSGGRCKSTIDLYKVPCPEKVYEIFIDMYMCGPNESF